MEAVYVYPLLTAAFYHLGARAVITTWLWSQWERWPRFDHFMSCAACSGTWYGAVVATIGYLLGWRFLGQHTWWTIPLVALCAMIWTPIVAQHQERALRELGGGTDDA